ncbi:hypothetical protein PINS_up001697 [Pythium insidiosum]|nr:hypothetical protein PINS_up001697 [Pythium insidiosum]
MDLAIRVNVRYAAPPNSQIKDALRLFKSPRWVQSIIRYIMPQLNSVSPAAMHVLDDLRRNATPPPCCENGETASCVVCMEALRDACAVLPCQHHFHFECIEPWLKMHSTCPTCRAQLPTDAYTHYSVYAINTTIILQQSQARMPAAELLELPASNQIIRAVVNARVRRNVPSEAQHDAMTQQSGDTELASVTLPVLQPAENAVLNASVVQRGGECSAMRFRADRTDPSTTCCKKTSSRRRSTARRRTRSDEQACPSGKHR